MNTKFVTGELFLIVVLMVTSVIWAQTKAQDLPNAPTPAKDLGAYADWFGRAGLTCGAGASDSAAAIKPTVQCGGLLSMPFFDLEAGVMGPQASRSAVSGYLSTNTWVSLIPFKDLGNKYGVPLLAGGYTRMFETGNALDYGVAFAKPIDSSHSIQFEARDYWTFANPDQNNIVFRVVWLVGLSD